MRTETSKVKLRLVIRPHPSLASRPMAAPPGSSIGSSSTKFNPSDFLKGLGWKGEGLGREQTGRVKHVTVAKKSSLSGVGKDRDTAFPWWEMVFKNVAGKVGGAGSVSSALSLSQRPEL